MMPFIFAIVDDHGDQSIFINTKECWAERGCLTDYYSEEESAILEPILKKARLYNLMESTYAAGPISQEFTDQELHQKLLACGLDFDPTFQEWMEGEVTKE